MARDKKSGTEPPTQIGNDRTQIENASAPGDPIETPSLFRERQPGAARTTEALSTTDRLAGLDVGGLIELRTLIDQRLPPLSIAQMNLEEEVILQFLQAKELVRRTTTRDTGFDLVPANQQAQVVNSCAAILKTLADAQTALYTAERVKAMEQALEKAFTGMPDEVKKAFVDRYKRLLRELADQKDAKKQSFVRENEVKTA